MFNLGWTVETPVSRHMTQSPEFTTSVGCAFGLWLAKRPITSWIPPPLSTMVNACCAPLETSAASIAWMSRLFNSRKYTKLDLSRYRNSLFEDKTPWDCFIFITGIPIPGKIILHSNMTCDSRRVMVARTLNSLPRPTQSRSLDVETCVDKNSRSLDCVTQLIEHHHSTTTVALENSSGIRQVIALLSRRDTLGRNEGKEWLHGRIEGSVWR